MSDATEAPARQPRGDAGRGSVAVVVPTYREAPNLEELVERLGAVRDESGIPLELVIVDDASDDDPTGVIAGLGRPWVRLIVREGERDLSTAVLRGIAETDAPTIVVMDADLSHPPERIPALLAALDAGAEMAVGSRRVPDASTDERWGIGRRLVSRLGAAVIAPLTSVRDSTSGFFAMRRALPDRCMDLRPTGYKIGLELIVRARCRDVREVPIHFGARRSGESKLTVRQGLRFLEHLRRLYVFAMREALLRPRRPGEGTLGVATPEPRRRALWLLGGVTIFAAVVALYAPAIRFGFLGYDDRFHIHQNDALVTPGPQRFTRFWAAPYGNLYVPLAYNLFAVEAIATDRGTEVRPADRFDPRVFHATSVVLQAIAGVLVLGILASLGAPLLASIVGAGLFALHPLQVEAVAWISEQRGLLAGVLALGAALVYLRSTGARRSRASVAGVVIGGVLFVLSMLSKPSTAALPVALVIVDVMVRRVPLRRSLVRMIPWIVAGLALLVVTRVLQQPEAARASAPLWARPLIAGDAITFYLEKLVLPFGLSPDHGRTPAAVLGGAWIFVAWLVPVAIACAMVLGRAWRGLAAFGVFAVMLAPVLGLVSFHHQDISTVADRYASLALLGAAMLGALVVARVPKRVGVPVALVVLVALGVDSRAQLTHWRSDETLWTHTLDVNPRSAMAHNNLGYWLDEQGRLDDALEHYRRAIALDPEVERARTNAGVALQKLGRGAEAETILHDALAQDPRDVRAMTALGVAYATSGRRDDGADLFRRALAIDPSDAEALSDLGLTRMEAGDAGEAERLYRAAIRANPWFAEAWHNLGVVLSRTGRLDEAIDAWRRAIECNPKLAPTQRRLGSALLGKNQLDAAEAHLREAVRLEPTNAAGHNNLGLIAIRRGDLDEAIAEFSEAVRLDPTLETAQENLANAKTLRARQDRPQAPP